MVVAGGIGVAVGTGTTDELPPACVAEVEVFGLLELEVGPLGEDVLGVLEELLIVVVELEGAGDVGMTMDDEVGPDVFFVEDGAGTILVEFIVTVVGRWLWVPLGLLSPIPGSETAPVILG